MSRRLRLGGECGQTAAEFLGVILVVAAMVGVIAASDIGGQIADGVSDEVCRVLKDDDDCARTKSPERAEAPDADGDGLSDREERRRGTLPGKADSDSDGLFDKDEIERGTDPREPDSDGDGLSDGREVRSGPGGGEDFDPLKADEDGDGLNDAQELAAGTPPDEADGDHDGFGGLTDGLTDREEVLRHGTDPTKIDTDGDGDGDGDEVAAGTNPLVDERSLGEKVAPIGEDLLLGDLPTPAAIGTALKKLPGLGKALKKLLGSGDDAAKAFEKNAEKALERKRRVEQATPPPRTPATKGADEAVNLASSSRTRHILHGDRTGGGHLWPGRPGKTAFPRDWDADRVMHEVSDIATDPRATVVGQQGRRTVLEGTRGGVRIRVVTDGRDIITGYPTNLPRNPR